MFGCGFRLSIQRVVRKRATGFVRCLSTRKRGFQLDALPFTVPPSDAYAKFEQWANDEQGLGPLLSIGTAKITAAYAPFWYFDLNIRFVGPRSYLATPEPFRSAFPNPPNGVIHIPGLAAYAGFSYRRSLIDPVHNTTPVYINHSCEPNCAVHRWKVRGISRAGVFALREIGEGEELSFDYQWDRKRGRALTKCHCGSEKCRGTIESEKKKDNDGGYYGSVKRGEEEELLDEGHWLEMQNNGEE